MHDHERLKRLRSLVARLEAMPPSPDRDRLLADARGRVVDVDTGEVTRPMRDVDADLAAIAREAAIAPRPEPSARPAASAPAAGPPPAAPFAAPTRAYEPAPPVPADTLDFDDAEDWVLNVDDEPLPEPDTTHARPWTLGLRG